jgi:predicted DCC family thiol-disulfide oxidoreductase YuxK
VCDVTHQAPPTSARPHPRAICFYDGGCGFCRRSTNILRRLDWLHQLDFVDQTTLSDQQLPVPREAAMKGMPLQTRQGQIFIGFPAIRRALLVTPLGCLPALLLYLPVLSQLARRAYEYIAARRGRDSCSIHH